MRIGRMIRIGRMSELVQSFHADVFAFDAIGDDVTTI